MRKPAALPSIPIIDFGCREEDHRTTHTKEATLAVVRPKKDTLRRSALKRRFCDNGTDRVREGELSRILKINFTQRKHHSDGSDNDDKGHKRQISGSDFFFALRATPRL
jgi:hypothetical protein